MGVLMVKGYTDAGRILLSDVQVGAVFIPTKIVMGSGKMPPGKTPESMTDVVTPVLNIPVSKKKRTDDGNAVFGGVYQNNDITEAFFYREIALYARAEYRDADGNSIVEIPECLYFYGNFGENADLMPAYSTGTVVERHIDLWVMIGGRDTEVDLTVESGIYATKEELAQVKMLTDITEEEYTALIGMLDGGGA